MKASIKHRTTAPDESGTTSEGLTTMALPAISAGMLRSTISSTGKFHGEQIDTTPCGCRTMTELPWISGSFAARTRSQYSSLFALSSTSSSASLSILPISMVMDRARPALSMPMRVTASFTSAVRSGRLTAAHPIWAARAAATAASSCSLVVTGTRSITAPVAGFTSTMHPCSMTTPCTIGKKRGVVDA